MTLIATIIAPGCVRVYDTGLGRTHFLGEAAWNAVNPSTPGAQSRVAAAAEFTFGGQGEPIKPFKLEPAITHYLQLRAGATPAKAAIPAAVLAAVAALNAYVTA